MKISELITNLYGYQLDLGDIEVRVYDGTLGTPTRTTYVEPAIYHFASSEKIVIAP